MLGGISSDMEKTEVVKTSEFLWVVFRWICHFWVIRCRGGLYWTVVAKILKRLLPVDGLRSGGYRNLGELCLLNGIRRVKNRGNWAKGISWDFRIACVIGGG